DPVDDLRNDRIAVADDAGEQLLAGLELADDVPPQFVLDGARAVAGLFQLPKRGGAGMTHAEISPGRYSGKTTVDDREGEGGESIGWAVGSRQWAGRTGEWGEAGGE